MFANQAAFNNPQSRMQALGMDTRTEKAIVNAMGQPVIYPQTGGMIHPTRFEITQGTELYRFGASHVSTEQLVTGGWWMEKSSFEKLCRFAQLNNISVAMAARLYCCVPPEWSDMGQLVRAKAVDPLLAYRGLGNDVDTPHPDGKARVRMKAHNNIAARRLYQLYIPGLWDHAKKTTERRMPGAIQPIRVFKIRKEDAAKGWLYL